MSRDVIVDEVRRVRHELVKRYGGLDGWIEHLQSVDRNRARVAKQRTTKKQATRRTRASKLRTRRSVKPPATS